MPSWSDIENNLEVGQTIENLPTGYRFNAEFFNTFLYAFKEKAYLVYPRFTGFDSFSDFTYGEGWTDDFVNKIYSFFNQCKFLYQNYVWVEEALYDDPVLWPTTDGSSSYSLTSTDVQTAMGTEAYQKVFFSALRKDWDFAKASVWAGLYKLHKLLRFIRQTRTTDSGSPPYNRPFVKSSRIDRISDPNRDSGPAAFGDNVYQSSYPSGPYPNNDASYSDTVDRGALGWDTYIDAPNQTANGTGFSLSQRFRHDHTWRRPSFPATPFTLDFDYATISHSAVIDQDAQLRMWAYGHRLSDDQKIALGVRGYLISSLNHIQYTYQNNFTGNVSSTAAYYPLFPKILFGDGTTHQAATLTQGTDTNEGYCDTDFSGGAGIQDYTIPDESQFVNPNDDPAALASNFTTYAQAVIEDRYYFVEYASRAIVDLNSTELDFYIPPS